MSVIKNIFGASPDINKVDKNNDTKKVRSGVKSTGNMKEGAQIVGTGDKADISSAGREIYNLKLEAAKYVDQAKSAETISVQEVEAIKEKIASNYYFDSEVIDKIVDKLMALPNFK